MQPTIPLLLTSTGPAGSLGLTSSGVFDSSRLVQKSILHFRHLPLTLAPSISIPVFDSHLVRRTLESIHVTPRILPALAAPSPLLSSLVLVALPFSLSTSVPCY